MENKITKYKKQIIAKTAIFNNEGRILILKRGLTAPTEPGMWDLPGGHVHDEEDVCLGMEREVFEETSLKLGTYKFIIRYNNARYYYSDEPIGNINLSFEHTDYQWISIPDLELYNMNKEYKLAIKEAWETYNVRKDS